MQALPTFFFAIAATVFENILLIAFRKSFQIMAIISNTNAIIVLVTKKGLGTDLVLAKLGLFDKNNRRIHFKHSNKQLVYF